MGMIAGTTVLLVGILWLKGEYALFARESQTLRQEYVDSQKAIIRNEVETVQGEVQYRHATSEALLRGMLQSQVYAAHAIASHLVETEAGNKSRAELEHLVKEALRPIRFNSGRGYVFMVSLKGEEELYPVAPQFEGVNLLGLQDAKGHFVIRDELQLLGKQPEGFVFDYWQKPGSPGAMIYPKITFLKRFEPFGWYIGAGEYIDDFEKDLQEDLLERISRVRFGTEGYVFVNTYDGRPLISDGHRVKEPKNLWELTDPHGIKVIQEERRACDKPEGDFIYYTWNRLSRPEPSSKVSFIKGYPQWQWMIGAGVYLDQVDAVIAARRVELQHAVRARLLGIALILLGIGASVSVAASFFSRWTRRSFDAFSDFFQRAATQSMTIDETRLPFSEFVSLAHAANAMIESRVWAEKENQALQEHMLRLRKMEALGLLAGGVAHDLNNILSGLVMYPDLLLMDLPPDSPLRKPILRIQETGQRAAATVADLLAASRGARSETQVLVINAVVEAFLGSPEHQRQLQLHPAVDVRTALDPEVQRLQCSQAQLSKVLMNLVANAMDAIEGAGWVEISTLNCTLTQPRAGYDAIPPGDYVVLQVQDSGKGIPAADLNRVFEPFFTKKILGRAGTGLGLTVVWHAVKDNDGFIDLQSGPEGTTFELFFPAVHEPATEVVQPSREDVPRGQGESILVVDDEPGQREILSLLLDRLGYRVTLAASGEEALALVQKTRFDLLILDMIMAPGMGGRQTYEAILAQCPGQRAIIASGYAETEDIHRTLELGAREAVLKPFTLERIGRAIRAALT
jgi:signal transduction histidine kinase